MKKVTKIRICSWGLLCMTIMMLVSGLQLELNPYGPMGLVWLHIVVGILLMSGIFWHMKLHHWPRTVKTYINQHPWLGSFFLLTLITGVIASIHWLDTFCHTSIGGIHGKFGFLMILAVILHVRRHIRFYTH